MAVKESIIKAGREFKEKYGNYCQAARILRMMQEDLEELKSEIEDFRTDTLAGHTEDEDGYYDLEEMVDSVEEEFKDYAGMSLDDAIDICDDLNSED